jgi:deoxyadenosine/deoxycytidine kinase
MAGYLHPTNKKDNTIMSNTAVETMLSVVKNNEHQPSTWIVEANFKDQEFTLLIRYLQSHKIPFVSVYLYGDLDTLYSRYVNREPHRHPVHTSSQPMSYETFKASFNYYHTQYFEQSMISFDTTIFDDSTYEKLHALIKTHL